MVNVGSKIIWTEIAVLTFNYFSTLLRGKEINPLTWIGSQERDSKKWRAEYGVLSTQNRRLASGLYITSGHFVRKNLKVCIYNCLLIVTNIRFSLNYWFCNFIYTEIGGRMSLSVEWLKIEPNNLRNFVRFLAGTRNVTVRRVEATSGVQTAFCAKGTVAIPGTKR